MENFEVAAKVSRRGPLSNIEKRKIENLLETGLSLSEISSQTGFSNASVSRIKKLYQTKQNNFREVKVVELERDPSVLEIKGARLVIRDEKILFNIISKLLSNAI